MLRNPLDLLHPNLGRIPHAHLTLGLVSGPVEGILTLIAIYAIAAIKGGGSFWHQSMLASIGIQNNAVILDYFYNMAWTDWYLIYGGIMLVFNTVSSAQLVMKTRRARGQRARVALLGLVPFFVTWALITAYLYLQPHIRHNHLVPFIFFASIINAYSVSQRQSVSQMIVAHLTKSRFPFGNVLIIPILYGVVDSLGPVLQRNFGKAVEWPSALGDDVYQVAIVFCCLGLGMGVYGSFALYVIFAICDYLDIWCLTIKHPWVEPAEEAAKANGNG